MVLTSLGLFTTAVILDIIYLASGRGGFATAAGYVIGVGLVACLVATVGWLAAWTTLPRGTPSRRAGLWHSGGNVVVLLLFTASWFIRLVHSWVPGPAALICGLTGLALAGVTWWQGGDLPHPWRHPALPATSAVPRQPSR